MTGATRARGRSVAVISVVVAAAVIGAACGRGSIGLPPVKTTVPAPPTTATLPPAPGAAVTPALAVAGHLLTTASGDRFVIRGVTIYALPFYVVDGRPDPQLAAVTDSAYANRASMFATLKALGYNTVRIPLQASVVAADPYGLGGMRGYLDRLQAFVDAATGAGLYVDVSWWDAFNEGASLPGDYTAEFPMMKAVVDRFSDDPRVIYEPFNEPNGISWDQWIVTFERVLLYWRGSLGYRGVIIADTPNWSWDFDPTYAAALIRYDRALLGSPNLMIANHRYPNGNQCFCGTDRSMWVSTVGQYADRYPLVGTEYGVSDGYGPPEVSWGPSFLTYLTDVSIPQGFNGGITFVWNWIDANSMTSPPGGAMTTWGASATHVLAAP